MIYKLATENDISTLSEMRWLHEFEEDGEFQISKEEFISKCNSFLLEELKTNTWAYWIAEENGVIVSNIYKKNPQNTKTSETLCGNRLCYKCSYKR